jgi:hypothetical protein
VHTRAEKSASVYLSGITVGGVNLNLSVFWTLVVVIVGAPLLTMLLGVAAVAIAILLGYDPDTL